jgi:hypothetical protein
MEAKDITADSNSPEKIFAGAKECVEDKVF